MAVACPKVAKTEYMNMVQKRGSPPLKHFGRQASILAGVPSVICTQGEFHRLIDMECDRADRYQSRFSLALFDMGTNDENSVLIRRMVRTLHSRFRSTDELGWYSRHQIGIIMPFTPAEGAWKLAEYVCGVVAAVTFPPTFAIFSYPSECWPRNPLWRSVARLFGFSRLKEAMQSVRIPRAAEFHALIARERSRSDRNGNIFSLVVYDISAIYRAGVPPRLLVKTLAVRLRDTDEIGMLSRRHICAILPYTDAVAATQISESLCREICLPVKESFTVYTYPDKWFAGNSPLVGLTETAPDKAAFLYRPLPIWKRLLDVTGSLAAILLTLPLMLFTAALIKLVSPGPLLFRQVRVGLMGCTFTLFKFRTMKVNADSCVHNQYVRKLIVEDSESKPMVKLECNPDIIPMGWWIRTLCLDELPQLFNVLRGDMSLVGPRPCVPYEAVEYRRWHMRRFDSVPGMTGLWQVSGKNRTTFKEMIRFDIKYELNRSLWLDIWIILGTPWAIIRQLLDRYSDVPDVHKEATK
jgi:lipopolysaccharide/colanic/teichoic acid biosynthesis glycosyltransferase